MDRSDRVFPSAAALRAMAHRLSTIHKAPDIDAREVRGAIADYYGISFESVAVGNGCTELMAALACSKAGSLARMLRSCPAFPLYDQLANQFNYTVDTVPLRQLYWHDVESLINHVGVNTRLVWLDTPHYITGTALETDVMERFLRLRDDVITVFDNVYGELQGNDLTEFIRLLAGSDATNAVLCRTFSKAYAMLGIRVGYMIGSKRVVQTVQSRVLPFSINSLAQAGAIVAIRDHEALERNVTLNERAKAMAYAAASALGIPWVPTESSTLLLRLSERAGAFERFCDLHGAKIRGQGKCGIPGHVQIHLIDPQTVQGSLDALQRFMIEQEER